MYVDLVDDEDTQLMFDDWHDYSSANKNASKLHFFVDWRRDPLQNSNDVKAGNLGTTESVESIEAAGQRSPGKMDSAGKEKVPALKPHWQHCKRHVD